MHEMYFAGLPVFDRETFGGAAEGAEAGSDRHFLLFLSCSVTVQPSQKLFIVSTTGVHREGG